MVLKSIGVLSCGKILGTLYAFMGLIAGGFFALISLVGVAMPPQQDGGDAAMPLLFGGAAVIFMPVLYGIMGFIFGLIMAAIYNLVAGMIGGLELDLEPAASRY